MPECNQNEQIQNSMAHCWFSGYDPCYTVVLFILCYNIIISCLESPKQGSSYPITQMLFFKILYSKLLEEGILGSR